MDKLSALKKRLASYEKLCVGFSGGVDSTFLLKIAVDVLGENVFAIVAKGAMLAQRDFDDAATIAAKIGAVCHILEIDVFTEDHFVENTNLRCYYCKRAIFSKIKEKAFALSATHVADGKNADDAHEYRPGAKACEELSIVSPLFLEHFTKEDIRNYSKQLNLPTWNKPSNACLATRVPYHEKITIEKLQKIEAAENVLYNKDYAGIRVRYHGDMARIEAPKAYFSGILEDGTIVSEIKKTGFKYVALDLEGFRSGSMD